MKSRLEVSSTCSNFLRAMDFPRLWYFFKWDNKRIPNRAICLLNKHGQKIRVLTANILKEESMWSSYFNHSLHKMSNLVRVNLSHCMILYELDWLEYTPNVTSLIVSSCPHMSSMSFVEGVSSLPKIEYLECMNNSNRIVVIQIVELASHCPTLLQLNVYGTGNMRAWMAEEILVSCPELQGFMLSSNFIFDDSWDRIKWYRIVKRDYKDVSFSKNILRKVDEYINTCSIVNREAWYDAQKDKDKK